jgi:hypothetical protein
MDGMSKPQRDWDHNDYRDVGSWDVESEYDDDDDDDDYDEWGEYEDEEE